MRKKEILKKCDSYIELFKDSKNVERDNILEFLDFAYFHLPNSSNLAFEINQLNTEKFSEHAKRIKDFINTNGSKAMNEKKNFLSDKSNFEVLGIIFAICVFMFGIGYWAKEFEVFSVLSRTEKSTSLPTIDPTENVSDEKKEIKETNKSNNN